MAVPKPAREGGTDRFDTRPIDGLFQFQYQPVDQIETLQSAIQALSAPIDSYLEDHILSAEFHAVAYGTTKEQIGHIAIHGGSLLTQFYLQPWARRWGQSLYREIIRRLGLTAALVPTCDEFFLSHALDDYVDLHKQAYFFVTGAPVAPWDDMPGLHFRQATMTDHAATAALNDGFIDKLEERIARGEIHIGALDGAVVALGIRERGRLLPDCASIGMLVAQAHRQQGIGTRMIRYLRSVCEGQGLQPLAGCAYDNPLSKRTLEAAGMVTTTQLLRISYIQPA